MNHSRWYTTYTKQQEATEHRCDSIIMQQYVQYRSSKRKSLSIFDFMCFASLIYSILTAFYFILCVYCSQPRRIHSMSYFRVRLSRGVFPRNTKELTCCLTLYVFCCHFILQRNLSFEAQEVSSSPKDQTRPQWRPKVTRSDVSIFLPVLTRRRARLNLTWTRLFF